MKGRSWRWALANQPCNIFCFHPKNGFPAQATFYYFVGIFSVNLSEIVYHRHRFYAQNCELPKFSGDQREREMQKEHNYFCCYLRTRVTLVQNGFP